MGWLGTVTLGGSDDSVPVTLLKREGTRVVVRQVDPCDPDPERIPLFEGDELVVAQAISHISLHNNDISGDSSGLLFSVRVVEAGRAPGKVYARTLRRGEPDPGARVHVPPGETLEFAAGSISAELDHLDEMQEATATGYAPLSPTLSAWFAIGEHDPQRVRYWLAAARRLDEANRQVLRVNNSLQSLEEQSLAGPAIRVLAFELVGAVELAVVALRRAMSLVTDASARVGFTAAVPQSILDKNTAVKEIRDAYEHVEDRALGLVYGRPHPDALTIFHYQRLLSDRAITYGSHELSLDGDFPELLQEARAFIMSAAGHS